MTPKTQTITQSTMATSLDDSRGAHTSATSKSTASLWYKDVYAPVKASMGILSMCTHTLTPSQSPTDLTT